MKDKQKKAPRFSASVSQLHLKGRKRNLRHLIELRVHIFNNTLAMQGWNPRKRHRINIFILIFLYLEAEVEQSVLLLTKNPPPSLLPSSWEARHRNLRSCSVYSRWTANTVYLLPPDNFTSNLCFCSDSQRCRPRARPASLCLCRSAAHSLRPTLLQCIIHTHPCWW